MGDGVPFGQGWAATALPEPGQRPEGASVAPLLDAIAARVPPPGGDPSAPFALLVAMVEHDAFLGPVATGRVAAGTAAVGARVRVLHHAGARPGRKQSPSCTAAVYSWTEGCKCRLLRLHHRMLPTKPPAKSLYQQVICCLTLLLHNPHKCGRCPALHMSW